MLQMTLHSLKFKVYLKYNICFFSEIILWKNTNEIFLKKYEIVTHQMLKYLVSEYEKII